MSRGLEFMGLKGLDIWIKGYIRGCLWVTPDYF